MLIAESLPMTQEQGVYAGILIITIILLVNIFNGFYIKSTIDKKLEERNRELIEISKQLLVQSGYLKNDTNSGRRSGDS